MAHEIEEDFSSKTPDVTGINARVDAWIACVDELSIDKIDLSVMDDSDSDHSEDGLELTNPNLAAQFARGELILYVPPTAPKRGKKKEADPMMFPPASVDYRGIERLKQLLLPDEARSTCIRLLDGRELMRYIADGGKMKRRQELERSHPHLFATEELVHVLLNELAKDRTHRDLAGEEFVFFPGIVALSYAWSDTSHPDPGGEQMQLLGPVLEWYLCERARLRQRVKREFKDAPGLSFSQAKIAEDEAPNSVMFGIFVDFMCLHQTPCAEDEERYLSRAQFNVGMLYAHQRTMVFQLSHTAGGGGERTWEQRGWCRLEQRLAELVACSDFLLDISKFAQCKLARQFEFGSAAAYKKTGTKLAAQGDGEVTVSLLRAHRIGLPVFARDLKTEMFGKAFTLPEDLDLCVSIYSTCSKPLLAAKEELVVDGRVLTATEWEQLPRVLNVCETLQTVILRQGGMAGRHTLALFRTLDASALGELTYLDLSLNEQLGDDGARALAESMGLTSHLDSRCCGLRLQRAKPPAPTVLIHLRYLLLNGCGIRERGGALLLEATGSVRKLGVMDLSHNLIGDGGMRGFDRLRAGDMPVMLDLKLVGCGFGDGGCCALVEAMALGVMPRVQASGEPRRGIGVVNLQGNAFPAAREALGAVLREREGGGNQLFRSQTSSAAAIAKLRRVVGK